MVETHYSTPSNRQGLSCVLLMGVIGLMWGCQSSGGTLVTMTLNPVVTQSEVGKHYEVFAAINDGVVSLRRFDVQLIPIGSGSFIDGAYFEYGKKNLQGLREMLLPLLRKCRNKIERISSLWKMQKNEIL